jgi:hypothetical protein
MLAAQPVVLVLVPVPVWVAQVLVLLGHKHHKVSHQHR